MKKGTKKNKEFTDIIEDNIKMEKVGEDSYKVTSKLTKDSVEIWLKDVINNMDLKPHINFNTVTHMIEIRLDFSQDICYSTPPNNFENKTKNTDTSGLKYNI